VEDTSVITVGMVEDHAETREIYHLILTSAPDLRIVGTYDSGEAALAGLRLTRPNVVLMDFQLPGISGIECVRELKPELPDSQFMMVTLFEDNETVFQSLKAGATGYLEKRTANALLVDAIRELHAGGSPMSPAIARRVVVAFRDPAPTPDDPSALTAREIQIVEGLAQGSQYKEIAKKLDISFHTVRTHVQHIYKKLHVRTRKQAVEVGKRRRWF
jgi:DNA-binding NarL/FixJ family response regulator